MGFHHIQANPAKFNHMLDAIRSLFKPRHKMPPPAVPDGERHYLIGDIHGRLDLFEAMVAAIEDDDRSRPGMETQVVLLGDLVDRGPDSAGVVALARNWQSERRVRILAGNHEQMMLDAFKKPEILRHFLKHGGHETVMSYGLTKKQFSAMTLDELFEILPKLISEAEREYIASFEEYVIAGDYMFVHAGIDPQIPIEEQKRSDLLWIRDRFLSHEGPLEKVVVHGHTIFNKVMDCGNRIGIDTGAFRSGVLSALVLEGDQKRIIQTIREDGGPVEIFHGEKAS